MEKDFWLERWERKETGFHQDEINPYLRRYWPELHLAKGGEVFVPLYGRSARIGERRLSCLACLDG